MEIFYLENANVLYLSKCTLNYILRMQFAWCFPLYFNRNNKASKRGLMTYRGYYFFHDFKHKDHTLLEIYHTFQKYWMKYITVIYFFTIFCNVSWLHDSFYFKVYSVLFDLMIRLLFPVDFKYTAWNYFSV